MNYKLPILAAAALLQVSANWGITQTAQSESSPPDGQQLIQMAARQLLNQPPLECNVRQKINLFGQELIGPGSYQQFGSGKSMVRLELKLTVGGKVVSLQQVCDGRFFYVRQDLPNLTSLSRIDLQRVQEAIDAAGPNATPPPTANWMTRGGLPHLLQQLESNFEFTAPQASSLKQIPVWIVTGRWKQDRLAEMLPAQKDNILAGLPADLSQLPPQIPHEVEITLGHDDLFPLFPYRIVYRRLASPGGEGTPPQPIVVLEFFNVRRRLDMDPREFEYVPDDRELVDNTDEYLASLGLKAN